MEPIKSKFEEPIESTSMGSITSEYQNEWRFPAWPIYRARERRQIHWGTMSNRNTQRRKSTSENNYTRARPHSNSDDLSIVLPNEPPVFDPSATKALLRLLLEVRDRRRAQRTPNTMEAK